MSEHGLVYLPPLTPDEYMLLTSIVQFALERYEDNKSPLVEGYRKRLEELDAKLQKTRLA